MAVKNLVIIDGKSVFYRGYYAMGALALPDGTPTGGVYGFAAIAMEIVRKLKPSKVVVAWDSKSSTSKRRAIFADYKAGRVKPGEDFYAQIPLLEELVRDLGWVFVEVEDYEADDIIGTLSQQADDADEYETYIISSDLDMLQVVDHNTHMWRILKGFSNIEKIDVAELEAKYGIKKEQFLDLKALKGDTADNIPGVPGVGEKTAVKLLNDFGTLEGIYEHLGEIKGAVRGKLEAGIESAKMSKKLAKIMFDAPVKLDDVPDFVLDRERVVKGLEKLAFKSLIRKFVENDEVRDARSTVDVAEDVRIIDDEDTGSSSIGGISETINDEGMKQTNMFDVLDSDINTRYVEIDEAGEKMIIARDIKSLMHKSDEVAQRILAGEKFWDLSQAAFLIDPTKNVEGEDLEKIYRGQLSELEQLPYVKQVLIKLDLPLIPVLYKMEKHGVLIDRKCFEKLQTEFEKEVKRLEREIYETAGMEFNINSPMQLSEVLFEKLLLPTKGIRKTSRGYSTGIPELEKLKGEHKIIPQIMAYREAAKLLSTYIMPMPNLADAAGRIHTNFTQNVTATGRLSSQNPNLQNIPVRKEEGKRIREGFVAGDGKILVAADYSQFELRLAAAMSGDEKLIQDFNNGIDIHTKTAAEVFGLPMEKVTKDQRRAAKTINFGILYGMSAAGLAAATGMRIDEAKKFIDDYFALRAPVKKYLDQVLEKAKRLGYVETLYGRRKPTPNVGAGGNFNARAAAERAAMNMPIQGTEADLMKLAMIRVDKLLPEGANLVMQIHDSLMIECDEKDAEKVAEILKKTMEEVAPKLAVKLEVEVKTGKNWGEV